jgi:hypothetical protein
VWVKLASSHPRRLPCPQVFFATTRDFSSKRLWAVLVRLFATCILTCTLMGLPLTLYYVVPQAGLTVLLSYACVRLMAGLEGSGGRCLGSPSSPNSPNSPSSPGSVVGPVGIKPGADTPSPVQPRACTSTAPSGCSVGSAGDPIPSQSPARGGSTGVTSGILTLASHPLRFMLAPWAALAALAAVSVAVWDLQGWVLVWGWLPTLVPSVAHRVPLPQWALAETGSTCGGDDGRGGASNWLSCTAVRALDSVAGAVSGGRWGPGAGGPAHLDPLFEWRFRTALDHMTPLWGAALGLALVAARSRSPTCAPLVPPPVQWAGAVALSCGLMWWAVAVAPQPKLAFNALHPFVGILPIAGACIFSALLRFLKLSCSSHGSACPQRSNVHSPTTSRTSRLPLPSPPPLHSLHLGTQLHRQSSGPLLSIRRVCGPSHVGAVPTTGTYRGALRAVSHYPTRTDS